MKIIHKKDAFIRTREESTKICDYNFKTSSFDIVTATINGSHGPMRNKKTSRTYYVINGTGSFDMDDKSQKVEAGDIIHIEPKEWATIVGDNLEMIIVCTPPFMPDDYEEK